MVSSESGKPKRDTRSNRVTQQLAQLRQRNAEQLAETRERERRVDEALRDYATAAARIASADRAHEARVRRLRDKIDTLTTGHHEAVENDVEEQARAVRLIYDSGRTVRDLASLLDLSQRAVGRLLDRSRRSPTDGTAARPPQPRTTDPQPSHQPAAERDGEPPVEAVGAAPTAAVEARSGEARGWALDDPVPDG